MIIKKRIFFSKQRFEKVSVFFDIIFKTKDNEIKIKKNVFRKVLPCRFIGYGLLYYQE